MGLLNRGGLLAASVAVLTACAAGQETRQQLETESLSLVGLPKAQLISCAGTPEKSLETGRGEILTYSVGIEDRTPSTAGSVGVGVGGGSRGGVGVGVGLNFPLSPGFSRTFCEAVFDVQNGVVSDVTYNASSSIRGAGHRVCYEIVGSCLAAQ